MKLIKPESTHKESYQAYIQELGQENRYPFPLDFEFDSFAMWLEKVRDLEQGKGLSAGHVPSSTFFLVEDNEILAISNLRHSMSPLVERSGGHIGLSVRPSYRGQGLGAVILEKTIFEAVNMGIQEVRVYCYKHNLASAKMIQACNGRLLDEVEEGGKIIQRYLILK